MVYEQQLVRPNGDILINFRTPYRRLIYDPFPSEGIAGECTFRVRELPDGPWQTLAYLPNGYPADG